MKSLTGILFLMLMVFFSSAQAPLHNGMTAEEMVSSVFLDEGEVYFRFPCPDKPSLDEIGRFISVDKIDTEGFVRAYANRKGFGKFLERGIPFEKLRHPGLFDGYLNMKSEVDLREINEWDFYPTYDGYVSMMYQFEDLYPSLCRIESIGTTNQGRQLLVARISDNIGMNENEPQFLYTSSIHGDETTGYVLMLRLIDYLLSNYGSDPRITNMVDNIEICINPLANPDGTYHGGNNTVNGAYRYNAYWVDLNRNYPDPEDGMHPDGEDWQTETLHFMEFAENNRFVTSANLHGGEDVLNYPWDTWSKLSADDDWWQYVCREYADTVHEHCPWGYFTGFDNGITNGYQWYTITGGRQDYMNYFHQCREFTLEISDTKLLQPDSLPEYWEYNYRSFLNYIEQSSFGVRGTVKDSVTGWPVRAEVYAILHELDSSWVYSSLPNGNYHRLLHAGTYTLRYSAEGYITKILPGISLQNRQANIQDVLLVPEEYAIIDNNTRGDLISTYPNPVNGNLLHFDSGIRVNKIVVYNSAGHEIMAMNPGPDSGEIDLSGLSHGVYYVWFETEKGNSTKKVVIDR